MTEKSVKDPHTAVERNRETLKTRRFLEELAWLFKTYSSLEPSFIAKVIAGSISENATASSAVGGYASANPNKQFLVGALPRVFMDEMLFPTNEHIAQFAESVMELQIPRYGKKSKYEIIGHIVCETDALNDQKLEKLVSALGSLTDADDRTKRLVRERIAQNFQWNTIIQELAMNDNG
jgi:hypothetical protein